MHISLVRSVETQSRKEDRFEGISDSPVTPTGKEQADSLSEQFERADVDLIHSSPLKRALDTAKLISQELKTDIRIIQEIKDICYGTWEQQPKSEFRGSDDHRRRQDNSFNFTYPGTYDGVTGQSHADIYSRVVPYFETLFEEGAGHHIIVTHPAVIRGAKRHFEDCPPSEVMEFTLPPTGVYSVMIDEETNEPIVLNQE